MRDTVAEINIPRVCAVLGAFCVAACIGCGGEPPKPAKVKVQNGNNVFMGGRKIGGAINNQAHCGLLFGRIGEDGEIFVVGDRYEGTPETVGNLFLHIGPSQWNCQCIGSYEIKINVRND